MTKQVRAGRATMERRQPVKRRTGVELETGLFDHMVLQRNGRNVCDAVFAGRCDASGPVTATVRTGKRVVRNLVNLRVGTATGDRFHGRLKGVPVGGPYDIEIKVANTGRIVRDVLVGDVWLLGGQSNMQGCGLALERRSAPDREVRAFYMDDRWAVAHDPIHNMWACVDQVHIDICGGRPGRLATGSGVGPGLSFGHEMRRLTGVPQGLIACAHGGTSMTQWDPRRRNEGGKSLYGALVRRLRKNGGRVAGMIWYQGESDATAADAPLYTARMKKLVAALRRDADNRALPAAIVQIARVTGVWWTEPAAAWNSIQEQQRLLPLVIPRLAVVPAIDLSLDDDIHISGSGHQVLGKRLARAMQTLRAGRRTGPPPLAVGRIAVETDRGQGVVVAEFANVTGRLTAGSRPAGFAIVTPQGATNHFDIELNGACARIRSGLTPTDLAGATLHYGHGADPYCNIVDGSDRSLPVFGPVPVCPPRALTPYVRRLRVSEFQPSAGRLAKLVLPTGFDGLNMKERTFPDNFCCLHPEIAQRGGRDEVVYYAFRFRCDEAMRLALLLGYDGPVKAWVDGKRLLHDPNGTNPATCEKSGARFRARPGEHEIVVALGTNHGAAWGVFLRLERLGVPAALLRNGPQHYLLPELDG